MMAGGGGVFTPSSPWGFFLNNLKKTLEHLNFFTYLTSRLLKKFYVYAYVRVKDSQMEGRCFKKVRNA